MNTEETDAMRSLDSQLARLCAGLDTRPGFEDRLQARIAGLSAQHTAPTREWLECEHERARAAALRAARIDSLAVAIGGLGSVAAVWRFAPELMRGYEAVAGQVGPVAIGFGTLAVAMVALWGLLRRFDVDPRGLVGA